MWSWFRVEAPFLQELLIVINFSFYRIQVVMTHLCYNMELGELDQVTMVFWPGWWESNSDEDFTTKLYLVREFGC